MKIVKNYENFSEEYRLNENFLSNMWGAVIDYFKRRYGKNSWIYYGLYLQDKGALKGKKGPKVELICSPSYLSGLKNSDIPTDKDIEAEINSKFVDNVKVKENPSLSDQLKKKFLHKEDEEDIEVKNSKDSDEKNVKSDDLKNKKDLEELEDDLDFEEEESLHESDNYVSLNFPLQAGADGVVPTEQVRNVNVQELIKRVERVYKMNALRASRHQKDDYNIRSKYARKKTHALFIWGAPGIGKTEILHQVARKLDLFVQEWHLSQIEPTDFRGVPKVENILGSNDSKDRRTVSKLPSIFPTSDGNGKGGIMFFDEMNRAPEMVLAASLSLALSGKHGSYRLPPRWIVIAAGNRPTDLNLPGQDLTDDPILWNRFAHVNYAPKVGDWVEYAATQPEINPDLIAFLQFHKQYYHRYNPESKRKAWPSARSWDEASQIEYFARGENWSNKIPLKKVEEIYTDQVGKDAALDFISYLKLKEFYNEDDVRDVYEHGAKAKQPPKKLDQARAASASIAFWKKDEKLTPKELQNILDFSLNLPSIESRTGLAVFVKVAHPYIKDEEPYATIYDDFLMKWYDQLELEIGEDSDK